MVEAAAHHSCQTHPMFENLPPHARLPLLARCNGHWKQVLYFLECLLRMLGPSALASTRSNVNAGCATANTQHTLIVNIIRELYITSGADTLSRIYCNTPPEPQSNMRLIFSQLIANRILQISANIYHATFVIKTRQCWDGIYKVQVSTTWSHVATVTKAGRLFTWTDGSWGCLGHNNSCNELGPKRVKHGGFAELFIVCTSVGHYFSAAIVSSGLVVGFDWTYVVLNNGQVCYFGSTVGNLYNKK